MKLLALAAVALAILVAWWVRWWMRLNSARGARVQLPPAVEEGGLVDPIDPHLLA